MTNAGVVEQAFPRGASVRPVVSSLSNFSARNMAHARISISLRSYPNYGLQDFYYYLLLAERCINGGLFYFIFFNSLFS